MFKQVASNSKRFKKNFTLVPPTILQFVAKSKIQGRNPFNQNFQAEI